MSLPALWTAFRERVIGRRFVRDVGVLTVANVVSVGLSFAQGILVARWLGPELYGVAALVMTYPSLVHTFLDARSAEASVKYLSAFHVQNQRERALAMCKLGYVVDFAIASLAFALVLITAPWAARNIAHRPETVDLIVLYAAAFIPRAMVGTSHAALTTLGRFALIAWVETLTTLLRVVLVLGLVLTGWQVAAVVWGNTLATIATGLLYGMVALVLMQRTWGASPLRSGCKILKGHRWEIFRFLAFNDLYTLLDMIPKYLDIVMLGYFRNPTEVGYYKLAKNLAGALTNLTSPLQSVTYSRLTHSWGMGSAKNFRPMLYRLIVISGVMLSLILCSSFLIIRLLVLHLLGESYFMAILAIQLLVIVTGIHLAGFWIRPFYLATAQTRFLALIALVVAFISIPTYTMSILAWGFEGLAASRLGLAIIADITAAIVIIRWIMRKDDGILPT
jgi:O-antigen/teichoic acid export membrane protein